MTDPRDHQIELSNADQRLLDALVDAGFDPAALEALTDEQQERVATLTGLFGLLSDYPVEDADETLLHATMARIDRHEDERASRMRLEAELQPSGGRRIRLPDFISVAAVLLIVASIAWPMLHQLRQRSIDEGCANNLRLIGYALGNYAADYDGMMPIAQAGVGGSWDTVANFVNLKPLVDGQYCEMGHLECPGHRGHDDHSYSYRWQVPDSQVAWGVGRITIVMGDRNPLIDAARQGRVVPATMISLNHGGRGQNVLSSDGGTMWLVDPVIGRRDNIWLPEGVSRLTKGIRQNRPDDVFLAH